MLHATVLLPSALANPGLGFPAGIGLLQDLLCNCTITVDASGAIASMLARTIESWPPQYRKAGAALLRKLHDRGRLIVPTTPYTLAPACQHEACSHGVGIAIAAASPTVLAQGDCVPCCMGQHPNTVDVGTYPISTFSEMRRASSLVAKHSEWTIADAEARVFGPVLRSARHVKLIDRYVGRSVIKRGRGGVQVCSFSAGYFKTLEWLLGIFSNGGASRSNSVFEVYCGIQTGVLTASQVIQAVGVIRTAEASLRSKFGVPISFIVKREDGGAVLPHSRAIITNQVSVQVDRGFDLLMSDAEMLAAGYPPGASLPRLRDLVVAYCDDYAVLEAQARLLPNA